MAGFRLRLRNVLNGRFVFDAQPSSDGKVRQTFVEPVKKKGGKEED